MALFIFILYLCINYHKMSNNASKITRQTSCNRNSQKREYFRNGHIPGNDTGHTSITNNHFEFNAHQNNNGN